MLIPTKIQIDKNIYEFIKQVHKELNYKSLSEYIRVAVIRLGQFAIIDF